MAKHTLKDILSIFSTHAQHTHEAAVQATYDAGHAAGQAEAKETLTTAHEASLGEKIKEAFEKGYAEAKAEFEAGLHSLEGKKTTGATSDVSEEESPAAPPVEVAKSSEVQKAASTTPAA